MGWGWGGGGGVRGCRNGEEIHSGQEVEDESHNLIVPIVTAKGIATSNDVIWGVV